MITLEELTNIRIALHMFVYPHHIDILLQDIQKRLRSDVMYDSMNKRLNIRSEQNPDLIRDLISDAFADFLNSPQVEECLKMNLSTEAFSNFKLATSIRKNYKYLYNATLISIVLANNETTQGGTGYIIQL